MTSEISLKNGLVKSMQVIPMRPLRAVSGELLTEVFGEQLTTSEATMTTAIM